MSKKQAKKKEQPKVDVDELFEGITNTPAPKIEVAKPKKPEIAVEREAGSADYTTAQSLVGKFWKRRTWLPFSKQAVKGKIILEHATEFLQAIADVPNKEKTLNRFVDETDSHSEWDRAHRKTSNERGEY